MNLPIPEIRVGPPMCCEGLAVFPLYAERCSLLRPGIRPRPRGDGAGDVTVREVSSVGSVAELLVVNRGDLPCLFLEGTLLRGRSRTGCWTRPCWSAGSQARIPVSCVERGRWGGASRRFRPDRIPRRPCDDCSRRTGLPAGDRLGGSQAAVWAAIRQRMPS